MLICQHSIFTIRSKKQIQTSDHFNYFNRKRLEIRRAKRYRRIKERVGVPMKKGLAIIITAFRVR